MKTEMEFFEHLEELRIRLIKVIIGFLTAAAGSYFISEPVLEKLTASFNGGELILISPIEGLATRVKTAAALGFGITLPLLITQVFLFVNPALRGKERKVILGMIIPAVILFFAGAFFGYSVLLPVSVKFMTAAGPVFANPMFSLGSYVSFALRMILAPGVCFELPLLMVGACGIGLVSPGFWKLKRAFAILGTVTFAAVLTPTSDALNLIIISLPLIILYEIGATVSWIWGRRRSKAQESGL